MNYGETFKLVKKLSFDKDYIVCKSEEAELFILRPSKLTKRFKSYDVKRNFQIWLRIGEREFRPNHLRVMIDLHLRSRSRPDLKRDLLQAFDNIFYGSDPENEIRKLEKENFDHFLNPLPIIANLSQLFLIEQEYAYYGESNFSPINLFYQGWVRQSIATEKEIDNVCMSIANRQPPSPKYTSLDNRKHKDYQEKRKPLWYFEE